MHVIIPLNLFKKASVCLETVFRSSTTLNPYNKTYMMASIIPILTHEETEKLRNLPKSHS